MKKWIHRFKTPPHLKNTLPAPPRPVHLPDGVQWLSGEGAGSWFYAESVADHWVITRYAPDGRMECRGRFQVIGSNHLRTDKPFSFTHLSHCQTVHLLQDGVRLKLQRSEHI